MTNRDLMQAALKKQVVPYLRERGFEGAWPHFRRNRAGGVDLISFASDPGGGSFGISISAAFPNRRRTNLIWQDDMENLTAFHTRVRYSGMGMFERPGNFYYADVYRKQIRKTWFRTASSYVAAKNDKEAAQWTAEGYECISRFRRDTPDKICTLILTQLEGAFAWMEKYEKRNRR